MAHPFLIGNTYRKGKPPWNKGLNGIHLSPATEWKPGIGMGIGPAHPSWKEPIKKICEQCRISFERKPWQMSRDGHVGRFCSHLCYRQYKHLYESGPQARDWVGGEVTYRGKDWKHIRLKIISEQKGKCANCGIYVGNSLPVNHIRPFRDFLLPEIANHHKNLIGLCQSCHMKLEWRIWRKLGIRDRRRVAVALRREELVP